MAEGRRGLDARGLVSLAALIVILAATREASAVLIPLLVAALVVVVVSPFERRLIHRGWSRTASFITVTALTVLLVVGVVATLEIAFSAFIADLPSYEPGMEQLLAGTLRLGASVGLDFTHVVNAASTITGLFASADLLTRSLLSSLAQWTVVVLLVAFMMLEALDFPEKLARIVSGPENTKRLAAFVRDLSGFLRLATVDASVTAVADLVVLLVLGAPSAVLWAGLAFIFSFVPDVGYVMIVIPPTVATFIRFGVLRALLVLVSLSAVDITVGTYLLPRLIGSRLRIAPFWGVLSLVFWAWLLGPAGAVLAIPLTIAVRFLLESSPATTPLATLIEPLGRKP